VAFLKEQLETAHTLAGIQRGLDAVAAGRMKPARQVLEGMRKKHKIARS
jgi:hypothetical protein